MESVGELLAYEPLDFLSKASGLRIDEVNYVFCMLLAYPLAFLFRFVPASIPNLRHFLAGIVGLLFGIFCFRIHVLHVFVLAGGCYFFIRIDPEAKRLHRHVAIFSILYLTLCHAYRQYYHFGLYLLDITGPLMLLVQKLSSLGYSLHDAKNNKDKLTEIQKRLAVAETPSLLEYFGHVFFFPGFLAGPLHFYTDYKQYIHGKQPSAGSFLAAAKNFLFAFVCMAINRLPGFLGYDNNLSLLIQEAFVNDHSFLYRAGHMYLASVCIRMQYYFGWILAEGGNNMAGFGFDSVTQSWNRITNVNVLKVEGALSLKEVLDNWNMQTQTWLKYICYERTNNSVYKTMLLSAIWHGLYPGYFLTFLTAALQTEASRKVRRVIRPLFVAVGSAGLTLYHFLTWLTTAFILNYMVGPFVVLELWGSIKFWDNFLWVGHMGALVMFLGLMPLEGRAKSAVKKPKGDGTTAATKTEVKAKAE